ncbi:MAG: AAA family ATPase [Phycisphaerales bacterium]|nr:AAA family ATPase [Phycisphaerales bacterium]
MVAALQQLEDQFPFCPVNNAAEAISDIERLTGNFAEEHASVLWQAEARGENTTNSIRAPIEKGSARIEWDPVPIEDLGPAVPPDWLWTGFLAKQHITLFVGLWKCGKTTLVTHLLRDLKTGGGLIGTGAGGRKVLLVTEEGPTLWTRRRDDLGLSETVDVLIRPFMTKPDHAAWREFLEHLRALVIARGYDLVVFDTLSNLWPVMNENDAGEVGAALMPLRALSDAGPALMLIHHPRKGGGDEAQATRGSGALPGFVDVIMELGRYAKDDPYDRRRVLKTHSRFEESMPESVIELTDAGYLVVGDKIQVKQGDRAAVIAGILPEEGSGLTPEEVLDRWTTEPRPGLRSVETDLAAGASGGRWVKTGGGKRGDPFRFRRANGFDSRKPASLGARIESEPSAPAQTPAIKPMPEATDEGEWRAVV